jgi:lipopolysaccharide export system protein LptA
LLCRTSPALDSDRDKDINILADAATVDNKAGITIYSGRVKIDQGTLKISADVVKVIMDGSEVMQFIASMKPQSESLAHYEQKQQKDNELVSADAKTITYFFQEERLHLAGDAHLKQTKNTFSGELLYYDVANGIVDVKGSGKKTGGRVSVVISPRTSN